MNLPTVEDVRVRARGFYMMPSTTGLSRSELLRAAEAGAPIEIRKPEPLEYVPGPVIEIGAGPHRFSEPCL